MPPTDKLLVSVREARRLLSISHNTIWRLIREGDLKVVGGPSKRIVVVASINDYIARQIAAADATRGQVRPALAKMQTAAAAARAAKETKACEEAAAP